MGGIEEKLENIKSLVAGMERPAVVVEAAHIYTDEQPTRKHEQGAEIGGRVASFLAGMGLDVQRMLFVDDLNAHSQDLDLSSYQSMISERGFSPDVLIMESTLQEDADEIIRSLQDTGHTETNKHGAIILKKPYKRAKEIVLKKSPGRGETAACAALDAALYLKKREGAGISVTVLHEEWREQQEDVRRVLEALGVDIPVLEIYYDDEGEVEVEFDF